MSTFLVPEEENEEHLMHYGILRRSGRYPWGSGENPMQRSQGFFDTVAELRSKGMTDAEIAKAVGMKSSTELRDARTIARNAKKAAQISQATKLKAKMYSNVEIGKRMGLPESSVRGLLKAGEQEKVDILKGTADMLKQQLESKRFIDVGVGVENHLGISRDKLRTAVAMVKEEGYKLHYVKERQLGTGHETTLKVLSKPGVPYSEVFKNKDQIEQIAAFSSDGGRSYNRFQFPMSINSKRIEIKYAEDGGKQADGVIFVRPGVKDVSLDGSHYAQVRIAVDGTHYLKGMAMYKDDLPRGVDLQFNTAKSKAEAGTSKLSAMKPMQIDKTTGKIDQNNPFGSSIRRQIVERNADGSIKRLTSAMNIVNEEGNWETWSRNLSSQFLSKQSHSLAQQQLDMTYERRKNELAEIKKLTNPAVRRKLLDTFADGADSAAVHLQAAALPRQASHVILPLKSIKDTEIYAPNFRQGERVVLVRHPHGGPFEIPELVVNNRQAEGKRLLSRTPDAVGIHPKVAERLSGADFDGDTVIVIPNNHGLVKTQGALKGLENFDPRRDYPKYEGMKPMSPASKQHQMGDISNLITDMSIGGASHDELARAVRHSMVVIDAEKHELNYRQSAIDNGIAQLKAKYQERAKGGASTLISRAGSRVFVPDLKPRSAREGGAIDKATGRKMFGEPKTFTTKDGQTVVKRRRSTKLAETSDAHTLVSKMRTKMETIYANHSNKLKALANEARKESVHTTSIPYSPSARRAYTKQVESLTAKLHLAEKNAPLERQAQLIANATMAERRRANPSMEPDTEKKLKYQALNEARDRVGAGKIKITIEPEEWKAIQAGAVTNHRLSSILNHADLDKVKELATPRTKLLMNNTNVARAQAMLNQGYTQAEVADQLGVSLTTLKTGIGGKG